LEKQLINVTLCRVSNRSTTCGVRAKMDRGGGTAACHAQPAEKPLGPGLAARSSRGGSPRRAGTGRAPNSRGAVTARSSSARQCGDALDGGVVGAGRWQGAAGEHRWGPGVAPGRRSGGGAHPSGGSSCRGGAGCRRRGAGRRQGRWGSGEQRGVGHEVGKGAAGVVSERRGGIAVRWRENSAGGSGVPFLKGATGR
jgi:hypothetical protein